MHLSILLDLHRSLILLHPLVDVTNVATVLAAASVALLAHHVLLLVLQLPLRLVVHLAHLAQLVHLRHAFLTHHRLRLLLRLFQFFLDAQLAPHLRLEDLLGDAGVDGHQSILLLLELLLGDGRFLEVVLLLVVGKPLGELVVVLKSEPPVRVIDDFLSGTISEHVLGDGQGFGQLVDIVILHLLLLDDLDLHVLALLDALLQLLLLLLLVLLHLLAPPLHVGHRLGDHIGVIV